MKDYSFKINGHNQYKFDKRDRIAGVGGRAKRGGGRGRASGGPGHGGQ